VSTNTAISSAGAPIGMAELRRVFQPLFAIGWRVKTDHAAHFAAGRSAFALFNTSQNLIGDPHLPGLVIPVASLFAF
jgi:hypothetical protein